MRLITRLVPYSALLTFALACATQSPNEGDDTAPSTGGSDAIAGNGMVGSGGTALSADGGTSAAGAGGSATGGTSAAGTGAGAAPGGSGVGGSGVGGSSVGPAGTGGAPPVAGAGGSTSLAGSGTSAAGSDTSMAGSGTSTAGSGGGTADATGLAELSIPFAAYKTSQSFEIYLTDPVDLSAATVSVVIRKVSGKSGGVQIMVKDGSAQSYAWAQSAWAGIDDTLMTDWSTLTLDVANPDSTDSNATFDPTAVTIITIQVAAGDPWYSDDAMTVEDPTALINPTVLDIDSVTVSGAGTYPGPWSFDADATALVPNLSEDGLAASPPYAVAGSTVTWK